MAMMIPLVPIPIHTPKTKLAPNLTRACRHLHDRPLHFPRPLFFKTPYHHKPNPTRTHDDHSVGGPKANPALPKPHHKHCPSALPAMIHYESQTIDRLCLIYSLNMLLQHRLADGPSIIAWLESLKAATPISRYDEIWPSNPPRFEGDGNFQTSVFQTWLSHNHHLDYQSISIREYSIESLNAKLDELSALHDCDLPGFIIHTDEGTAALPFSHASTLLRHHGTWYWLDSLFPQRYILTPELLNHLDQKKAVDLNGRRALYPRPHIVLKINLEDAPEHNAFGRLLHSTGLMP